MKTPQERLGELIAQSSRIVFFGGAGVSTESGIPDFRSADGLYCRQGVIAPETILSHSFFIEYPERFFDFYRKNMLFPDAKPNAAHRALAALERAGKLKAVITQNIDGLHQAAGSERVLELHGSVLRNRCMRCHRAYPLSFVLESEGVPRCSCGGIVKPDVVLYEEALDGATLGRATAALEAADLLIVGGTSLAVYPAAGLIHSFSGSRLVLINRSPTRLDKGADLVIAGSIGEVLGQLSLE